MVFLLRVIGIFALLVCVERPAHAQNQPWCLFKDYAGGWADCRYATLDRCLADRLVLRTQSVSILAGAKFEIAAAVVRACIME